MPRNTDWTLVTLKEHFEKVLDERYTVVQVTIQGTQDSIDKADTRLDLILQEFPQEYARREEFESLRSEISNIKIDHVQRREFDGLKDEQSQGRGARTAITAGAGIVLALITVALGTMYANQLSHNDVSQQIGVESPWLADRPALEESIHQLEQQVILLKTQLAAHEATDKIRAATKK